MDATEHLLFIARLRVESGRESQVQQIEMIDQIAAAHRASAAYGRGDDANDPLAQLSVKWGHKYRQLIYPS